METHIDYATYIGIPFADKGRSASGLDCYGLIILLFAERGIRLPDFTGSYSDSEDSESITGLVMAERGNWQQVKEPEEGAVIVFNMAGLPFHVGYCIGRRQGKWKFIHVLKNTNVSVEDLYGPLWVNRIAGMYRYE